MASDPKKDFNKFIDNYITDIRRTRGYGELVPHPARPVKLDRSEVLEERELERADVQGKGLMTRVYQSLFGAKARTMSDSTVLDDDGFEVVTLQQERPRQAMRAQVARPALRTPGISSQSSHPMPQRMPGQSAPPVGLAGPDQELKFVLRLMESWLSKANKNDRNVFLSSYEYKIYERIRKKHLLQ